MSIEHLDIDFIINTIASSDGDVNLAAERISKRSGTHVTDYDVEERIAACDAQEHERLFGKLRALLAVRLYHLLHTAHLELLQSIPDLKPAELAKAHSSLVNSFTSLTASAAKPMIDYENEIDKLVTEFPDLSREEIMAEIKSMKKIQTTGFSSSRS